MGVNSPPSVSTRVADSFVAVYYRVISALPARLPELYGPDSELNHGSALVAHGPPAIGALAPDLPLAQAGALASIASISVQNAAAAGFVVAVVGTFRKKDNPAAVFAHTFVLEKQSHSHDDHYFCRNDIFVDLSVAPLPGGPPPPMPVPETASAQPAKPVEHAPKDPPVAAPNGPAQPPAPAHHTQHQVLPPQPETSAPVSISPPAPPAAHQPVSTPEAPVATERAVPDTKINGTADQDDTTPPDPHHSASAQQTQQPEPAQTPPNEPDPHPASESEPVTKDVPQPNPAPEQPKQAPPAAAPAPPAPPAKKTWASIVSSKEEAAAAAAAAATATAAAAAAATAAATPAAKVKLAEAPAQTQAANAAVAEAPKQAVENASAQPPATESFEHMPPIASEETSSRPPAASHTSTSRAPTTAQNGHRPTHVGSRGHPRVFGPTAVIQLGTLSSAQLQDTRALAGSLREEFNMYGFKVRHVDVKAQKSIAFIEYETIEGVRAAVAAWANGARQEGAFAGIPLNVTEKRPYNKWRPGSARGGRGGARGGRRNRPASTPLS